MAVICFILTMIVLYTPITMAFFTPMLYTNEIHASVVIPSLPIVSNLLLVAHIAAAIPAIIIGPLLFASEWRQKRPDLHRRFGKIYVFGCLLSAILVLPLSMRNGLPIKPEMNSAGEIIMLHPNAFLSSQIGFTTMAICWFFITYFAYTAARNKNFIAHRRWIMRSYAMTFAFIHVNLTYKLTGVYIFLEFEQVRIMQSMVSWMADLLIVEIYLAGTTHTGKFLGFKKWFHNLTSTSKFDRFYWRSKRS
jgi:hypothetical protein